MARRSRYSPEVKERAVRMVLDQQHQHESQWAAIVSVASKIGCTSETLRKWVRQAERDTGKRVGLTTDERTRLKAPGWNLRAVLQTARCGTRHRAGSDGAALPVAEPLRRTGHWKHSARVARSRDHPRRATPQANPARIRRLLSFLPDSFIARERCPRATTCAVAFDGARDSHSEGRRPPSLLQSSRCLSSLRLTRCPWDTSRGVLGRASIPRSP